MKKLTEKQKYNILRRAKKMYLKEGIGRTGMCHCIDNAMRLFILKKLHDDPYLYGFDDISYDYIELVFPEFNPVTLSAKPNSNPRGYWWSVNDFQSRIRAFDKLIEIYKKTKRLKL